MIASGTNTFIIFSSHSFCFIILSSKVNLIILRGIMCVPLAILYQESPNLPVACWDLILAWEF